MVAWYHFQSTKMEKILAIPIEMTTSYQSGTFLSSRPKSIGGREYFGCKQSFLGVYPEEFDDAIEFFLPHFISDSLLNFSEFFIAGSNLYMSKEALKLWGLKRTCRFFRFKKLLGRNGVDFCEFCISSRGFHRAERQIFPRVASEESALLFEKYN